MNSILSQLKAFDCLVTAFTLNGLSHAAHTHLTPLAGTRRRRRRRRRDHRGVAWAHIRSFLFIDCE